MAFRELKMSYQMKYPELAEALYLALVEDTFYRTMEKASRGDADAQKQAMLEYMDFAIVESEKYGECFIPQQHYGVSVWLKPLADDLEVERARLKKDFILSHMGENCYQTYAEVVSFMEEESKLLIAQEAWYLSILGILPDYQGQGLGPGLVEGVLEKTDKLGVATYLETFTPRNMTFYSRLGYTTLKSVQIPNFDLEYWILQREPRAN